MTFLDAAYKILKENGRSLHSKKITEIALKRKLLETAGKTPTATMNALLVLSAEKKIQGLKKPVLRSLH